MPLQKLQFRPGINKEMTSYQNEGGWFDGDKVRFRSGTPEKIGGWVKYSTSTYLGSARAILPFVALDGTTFIGVGTNLKYYIVQGSDFNDITPIRQTTSAGDVTFEANMFISTTNISSPSAFTPGETVTGGTSGATARVNFSQVQFSLVAVPSISGTFQVGETITGGTSGVTAEVTNTFFCNRVTVTDTGNNVVDGDFVRFSGAVGLGGNITADLLNKEYQVVDVISSSKYDIAITDSSGTDVHANSSDTGDGGSSVVGEYQINSGLNTTVLGTGWGTGTWGRGTWNSSSTLTDISIVLRLWSHDNFGEDLIFNVRGGGIYYWDRTLDVTSRGLELSARPGADAGTPTIANQIIVSDTDRHVIAFGADPVDDIGTQDPLLIRFSGQEDPLTWTPAVTNTAGDIRLGSGTRIVAATETRRQILVLTDKSAHVMQFIGAPFTFGIDQIASNTTILSPNSLKAVDDVAFWMGDGDFYQYDGAVSKIPCTVRAYVFQDINALQKEKVFAALNSEFNEIWWFYCSANSEDIDRYVIYNYQEGSWSIGTMGRTAWVDRGVLQNPLAATYNNFLVYHERGFDDGTTDPVTPINSFVESSQISIGDGDRYAFVRRIIPDITFKQSPSTAPVANIVLKARDFPGEDYDQKDGGEVTRTTRQALGVVEQFTNQIHTRIRGRSIALRVESSDNQVFWKLGAPRIDIRPDGRR